MKAHSYILPIMTISALLTACSGGGNSGGSSHTQPAAVNPQTVVKENKQKEHKTSPKPMEKPAVVEKKPVEKPVVVENNPVEKKNCCC